MVMVLVCQVRNMGTTAVWDLINRAASYVLWGTRPEPQENKERVKVQCDVEAQTYLRVAVELRNDSDAQEPSGDRYHIGLRRVVLKRKGRTDE